MYNYFLTHEAKEDLLRIYEFGIHRFGEIQADKYIIMLHDCFDKIASNPFMFPVVSKYKNVERFCVCGVDTIYFNIKEDEIEIITIIGRQDF
ncbi:type II toxin-antitoxin system RelE/ParE family toxin [Flavobacterium sp. RSP46]|uniref:type II toxin-antitoxin system RelE/ParE family toxin n=1 Tax=Flavobacterium sp. RSP46 TaxID=2497486 RepID=UPI000F88AD3E|nr:type II toxin-antitoxin system RelE/ParE family toxin [Flavobacterium sp. RSP46]RTY90211.1 type II toxin-antitoxin system RelE/ParE family toxin [Flavobacterium sp. RSP46]